MNRRLNSIKERGAKPVKTYRKVDPFPFLIPAGEVYCGYRLTILETHRGGNAQVVSCPPENQHDRGEVRVESICKNGESVKYQIEAFSCPESDRANPVTRRMTDFTPADNGFPFDNKFIDTKPYKVLDKLKWGHANAGLCGGMAYTALDYFSAGLKIPAVPPEDLDAEINTPKDGELFFYFGKRQLDSFNVPTGVLKFLDFMSHFSPGTSKRRDNPELTPHSLAWMMMREEWPIIKNKLDCGQPCPLGLVGAMLVPPKDLKVNHQVLAYGYDLVGDDLTLFIYDPNCHGKDNITLKLNIGNPKSKTKVTYSINKKYHSFFHLDYAFSVPPGGAEFPGRAILFEDEDFCGGSINIVGGHPDLSAFKAGNFTSTTYSMVILSGYWSFFKEPDYKVPFMKDGKRLLIGPGDYVKVSNLGIKDREMISLKSIPQ